jgi:basic membrane protein A
MFGTLRLDGDGFAVLGPPKQRAVLAILAVNAGRVVSTSDLIDWVWGETPPRTAAHSVQIYVSELRKPLATDASLTIETVRPGYRLTADEGAIDVVEFQRLVSTGMSNGELSVLKSALGMWTADPLDEFRFESWARPYIERLVELRSEAAAHLASTSLDDDDPQRALQWAEMALAAGQFGERGCELVMLSQYRLGRHAEALRTYDEFRRRLGEERGLTPTPALQQRHQQVLTHDPALDAPTLVGIGGAGSGGKRRRRRVLVAAIVVAGAVSGGVALALENSSDAPTPKRALMVHNVLSEIRVQYEQGFDEAIQTTRLTGETLDAEVDSSTIESRLVAGVDLLVVPAVNFDVAGAATAHPETSVVAFDQVVPGANVTSVIINSNEASYLAGAAAALTTKTGKVGFIGGVDEEVIWEFAAGFVAGVVATDPDVEVDVEYLAQIPDFSDGFQNPAAGEAAARRMFTGGADVIFAAAGTSGLGVFEAAADVTNETGTFRWAIGVDTDQYETVHTLPLSIDPERWSPHILTSVLKHSDQAIGDAVEAFADGKLEPGVRLLDLADGVGGLSYSGGFIDRHRAQLEQIQQQIIDGEIDVPCRPADRLAAATPERVHPCE